MAAWFCPCLISFVPILLGWLVFTSPYPKLRKVWYVFLGWDYSFGAKNWRWRKFITSTRLRTLQKLKLISVIYQHYIYQVRGVWHWRDGQHYEMCLQPKHPLRHLLLFSHFLAAHDLYDPGLLSSLQVAVQFCILTQLMNWKGGSEAEECDGNDNKHPPSPNKRRLQVQINGHFAKH